MRPKSCIISVSLRSGHDPAPALPAWKKNVMRRGLLHWREYCMKLQRAHRANFFARARGRRRIATLSLLRWWTRTSLAVLLMVTASLHWASTRAKCSMTAWKRWAASERRYRTLLSRGRRRSRAIAGDVARAQRMALDRWRSFVWWREQAGLSMHYSARRRVADGFAALLDLPEQARARELLHSIAQQHHRTRILAGWQRCAAARHVV